MKLVSNWAEIARKSWSFRLAFVTVILAVAEVTLPLFYDVIPRNTFALLMGITAAGTVIARLIDQPKMRK